MLRSEEGAHLLLCHKRACERIRAGKLPDARRVVLAQGVGALHPCKVHNIGCAPGLSGCEHTRGHQTALTAALRSNHVNVRFSAVCMPQQKACARGWGARAVGHTLLSQRDNIPDMRLIGIGS